MMFFCDLNIDLSRQAHAILDDLNQELDIQNLKLKHLLEYLKILNDAIQNTDVFYNPEKITQLLRELKYNIDNLRKAISDLEKFKDFVTTMLNRLSIELPIKKEELDNYNNLYLTWKKSMYVLSAKIETFAFHYVKNMRYVMAETIMGDSKCIDEEEAMSAKANNNSQEKIGAQVVDANEIKEESNADSNTKEKADVQVVNANEIKEESNADSNAKEKADVQVVNANEIKEESNADSNPEEKADSQVVNEVKEENIVVNASEDNLQNVSAPQEAKKVEIVDNNVLLISETKNKVFLPYRVSDLKKKLNNDSHYTSLQEIIDKEYTFSLDRYKSASISRFKEAYNLMRKKEKSTIIDSLDLALELSFNSLLNPAVISACRNLDELDIYLDCLALNELDKFNIFEIKYEIAPIAMPKKERF